jgi:hypothetical protein
MAQEKPRFIGGMNEGEDPGTLRDRGIRLALDRLGRDDVSPETKAEIRAILAALGLSNEEIEDVAQGSKALARMSGGFSARGQRGSVL